MRRSEIHLKEDVGKLSLWYVVFIPYIDIVSPQFEAASVFLKLIAERNVRKHDSRSLQPRDCILLG